MKGMKGWHIAGSNKKLHYLVGAPKDNIGCLTICKKLVNGISVVEFPNEMEEYRCKTCTKLVNTK